ncbi:MAG: ROK family protein [Lachnospiraceae bacterium]|jgi:cellobiose-specific phosphotransferase system component IIB|nr:ROK family protein [Lachnospiraceae bacterium]
MDANTKKLRDNYLDWALSHSSDGVRIYEKKPDRFRFESDFAIGELNFYDLEKYVAELQITDRKTDETAFFLHFELNSLDYAKELFGEFWDTYQMVRDQRKVRVLLSCTSAVTTSYMANKLNEAAELLSLDYTFSAVSYMNIYEKSDENDMVLLAPQIASEAARLLEALPDLPVLCIPPGLFATYDAPAVLEFVRDSWKKHRMRERQEVQKKSASNIDNNLTILAIALLPQGKHKFRIYYRYYHHGMPEVEETVVKCHLNLVEDLCDILDTAACRHKKYDCIGISVGGVPHHGRLDLPCRIDPDFDLEGFLTERYHVPVLIKNNVNMAALGFFARHSHYRNLAFLSVPPGYRHGGVGSIVNEKLSEGSHGIAGEVKYLLKQHEKGDASDFRLLPDETLEVVEQYARNIIAINDPEILVIRSAQITDMHVLYERLRRDIPADYMPKLRKANDDDTLEYMLLGIMMMCISDHGGKGA